MIGIKRDRSWEHHFVITCKTKLEPIEICSCSLTFYITKLTQMLTLQWLRQMIRTKNSFSPYPFHAQQIWWKRHILGEPPFLVRMKQRTNKSWQYSHQLIFKVISSNKKKSRMVCLRPLSSSKKQSTSTSTSFCYYVTYFS